MKKSLAILAMTMMARPALAQDRRTIMLDWFVNPDHEPIILAEELGYFKDAGLEVELITPANRTIRRAWWRRGASVWRSAISPSCTSTGARGWIWCAPAR